MRNTSRIIVALHADVGRLIEIDMVKLRFRDVDASEQTGRIRNASENRAGVDLLSGTDGDFFEDTLYPGTNKQSLFLLVTQFIESLNLGYFRLLGSQLGLASFVGDGQFFFFDAQASNERFRASARDLGVYGSPDLLLEKSFIAIGLQF